MALSSVPGTMKALVLEAKGKGVILKTVPIPEPTLGSVVIRVLASHVNPDVPRLYSDKSVFSFPTPMIPGGRCVGRVAAVGPDTTSFSVDQLVMTDPFILARDDPSSWMLWGVSDGTSPGTKKLMAEQWRYSTWAEYAKVPLENICALNENRLCRELGYTIEELVQLTLDIVAFGGLRSIKVQPGERLIVTPATGSFSGAAVGVAVAMGASVIAVGRNISTLQKLKDAHPDQVETVVRTGEYEADKTAQMQYGSVDAILELSPPGADGSSHVQSALGALKQYGRLCIMGHGAGMKTHIEIGYTELCHRGLTIKGQPMYEREDVKLLIKMAESGVLKLGKKRGFGIAGAYKLEEVEEAVRVAGRKAGPGEMVVLTP